MKFEGKFLVKKRGRRSISGKIVGLEGLVSNSVMELAVPDPQAVEAQGTISVEIPDVPKPEAKKEAEAKAEAAAPAAEPAK